MSTNKVNTFFGGSSPGVGTALTITLASLASSTTFVGRQATEINLSGLSSSDLNPTKVTIYYSIKQGTSPTGNRGVYFYILNSDGTHRDGAAGASDAGFTIPPNLTPVHVAANKSSPATGDVLQGSFSFVVESPRFVLALYQDTGAALNGTGGNHYVQYTVSKNDIQAAA